MWFRSTYLVTLRGFRIAIAGWGYGMGLLVVEPMAGASALSSTAAGRAALSDIAASFAWNAAPVAIDTAAGYATFKIGVAILVMAIWPILAATRTLRGEEERGALDVVLSTPRSRTRVALEKVAAMATALLAMGVVAGIVVFAGSRVVGANITAQDALLFGLDLALVCAVFGGLALLISQFTTERRTAAGSTGGLLLVSIVVDMVHRIYPGLEWISRLSPVYYFNLSKPLVPSYGTNPWAMLVLLALALVLGGAAVALFAHRDVGGTVPLPRRLRLRRAPHEQPALPASDWSLRSVYARGLRTVAFPALWWTIGIAGFAGWMVVAVKQIQGTIEKLYSSASFLSTVIGRLGGGDARTGATLLSAVFSLLPVLLMVFVVTQVNRWAADEEDGRLDLLLSTPHSRVRVLLGRFAAVATATCTIGVVTLVVCAGAAAAAGVSLDGAHLAAATLGMIPLALLVAALGYLGAGWLRTAVDTGLTSLLLAAWFLISFVGPELGWPGAALRLSALYYYGTPLLHGMQATAVAGLLGAGVAALSLGAVRFARKDVGR